MTETLLPGKICPFLFSDYWWEVKDFSDKQRVNQDIINHENEVDQRYKTNITIESISVYKNL